MTRIAFIVALSLSTFSVSYGVQGEWAEFGHGANSTTRQSLDPTSIGIEWESEVGFSNAQIVGNGQSVFVVSGKNEKQGDNSVLLTSTVRSLNVNDGSEFWKYEFTGTQYDSQESFSGTPLAPQATPMMAGKFLVMVSFDGQLVCLDQKSGKLIYRKDLVGDLNADPCSIRFFFKPGIGPREPKSDARSCGWRRGWSVLFKSR